MNRAARRALSCRISSIRLQSLYADAQLFLDTIAQRCFFHAGGVGWDQPENFLNPLVQALYDCGHNGISLDVSDLPLKRSGLATNLTGGEEPLRLSLRLDIAEDLAPYAKNCDLTIHGNVVSLGYDADSTVFRCDGLVVEAGRLAEGCDFYLGSARCIESGSSSLDSSKRMKKCGFSISSGVSDVELLWLSGEGFFSEENRLYVPKTSAPGEWAEVVEP